MSEGGCGCTDDMEKCAGDHRGEGLDAYFDAYGDDLTEISGRFFCEEHAICECCEKSHEDLKPYDEDPDLILCPDCWDEDHDCSIKEKNHEAIH